MPWSSRNRVAEVFALKSSAFYVVGSTLFKSRFYEEKQCSLCSGQLATPSGAGFPRTTAGGSPEFFQWSSRVSQ
jgi:hypothetical protein